MKLKYQASKGTRIKKSRFFGMTPIDTNWEYNLDLKRWENKRSLIHELQSYQDCNSVRAFRRKLKKAPKGIKFVLRRWHGYDVYGVGNKEYSMAENLEILLNSRTNEENKADWEEIKKEFR